MEKYILTFALLIFELIAHGQIYYPLPNNNALWRVSYYDGAFCNGSYPSAELQYESAGDTTINSLTYHKYIKSGVNLQVCYPYPLSAIYYIRDDTTAKKIYLFYNGVDSLLYDFTLQPGDTISGFLVSSAYYLCQFSLYNTLRIKSIDSVMVGSKYHRRWNIADSCVQQRSYIEGIGSNAGLVESYFTFERGSYLDCFSINGQNLFPDTNASCYPLSTGELASTVQGKLSFYPNPLTSSSTLQLNTQLKDAEVVIYDVVGKEILSKKLTGSKMEIEKGSLESGVYFVRVRSEERQSAGGRIRCGEWVEKLVVE